MCFQIVKKIKAGECSSTVFVLSYSLIERDIDSAANVNHCTIIDFSEMFPKASRGTMCGLSATIVSPVLPWTPKWLTHT